MCRFLRCEFKTTRLDSTTVSARSRSRVQSPCRVFNPLRSGSLVQCKNLPRNERHEAKMRVIRGDRRAKSSLKGDHGLPLGTSIRGLRGQGKPSESVRCRYTHGPSLPSATSSTLAPCPRTHFSELTLRKTEQCLSQNRASMAPRGQHDGKRRSSVPGVERGAVPSKMEREVSEWRAEEG